MINLDRTAFEQAIKSSSPVIVDFWAPWCGPCMALAPILEDIESSRGAKGEVLKLNIDENQDVAAKYSVMSIPTMIVFKNGEEVDRMVGAPRSNTKEQIMELLNKNL